MPATRTLAFASLAVGTSVARAQLAPAPGASAGSAGSGLVAPPVALSFDSLDAPARDALASGADMPLDASADTTLGVGADLTLGAGANLLPAWRIDRWLPIGHGFSLHAFWNKGATATWNSTYSLGQSFGGGLAWHSRIGTISIDVAIPLGGGPAAVTFNYIKVF